MAEIKDESEQMTKKKPKRNKKKRREPRVDGLGNGGTNHVEPEKGIIEKVQVNVKDGTSKINGGTIEVEPEEGKVEKVKAKGGTGKSMESTGVIIGRENVVVVAATSSNGRGFVSQWWERRRVKWPYQEGV